MSTRTAHLISYGSMTLLAFAGQAAWAQSAPPAAEPDQDPELEQVVVTGTQIRGIAPIGASLATLDAEAIRETGVATPVEVLRQLPQVLGVGPGESVTNSSANAAGANVTNANTINLRGLGSQATLPLVNGRRPAPGGTAGGFYDPNNLPALAIKRVEVVADGASALYGSDAVAGVVNFVLRDDVRGVETHARYGFADDYDERQAGLIGGFAWDSGRVMLAYDRYEHSELNANDRPDLFQDDQRPYGGIDQRSFNAVPGNLQVGTVRYGLPGGSGQGLRFSDLSTTPQRLSSFVDNSVIGEVERNSAVLSVHQNVADVDLWLEGLYSDRTNRRAGTATTANLVVPSTNPFFIPGVPGATTTQTVLYSFQNDFGSQRRKSSETSWQTAAGATKQLGESWRAELYGAHSANTATEYRDLQVNGAALNAALADTNPATAFNPYGSGGNNNPATLDRIRAFGEFGGDTKLDVGSLKLDGRLMALRAGDLRMAAGVEYRKESLVNIDRRNTTTPNNTIIAYPTNLRSSRNVKAAFAELYVPIVGVDNALPALQRLELSLAGRYEKYSDFGDTSNPKIGLRWVPLAGVSVSASYGTSFRAPTLSNSNPLSLAAVQAVAQQIDPASPTGTSPMIRPTGGNADLKPEEATTWSLGVEYEPQWLEGAKFGANYFHVSYTDLIEQPGANNTTILNQQALYASLIRRVDPVNNPADLAYVQSIYALPYAGVIPFPATAVRVVVDGRFINAGSIKSDALDLQASYTFETALGRFTPGVLGSYTFKYDRSVISGGPMTDFVGFIEYPQRVRARGYLRWNKGGLRATGFLNYIDSYTNNRVLPSQDVASYTTLDLTLGYDTPEGNALLDNVSLSLDARNVLNRAPPFTLVGTQLYDSTAASPIGRMIALDIVKRF